MKKRVIAMLLAAVMLLSLVGCGADTLAWEESSVSDNEMYVEANKKCMLNNE